jgi:hypothetical protein
MSYRGHEPSIPFDFASLDGPEAVSLDQRFWTAQSELFADVLRWLSTPRSLSGKGARLCVLCLFLRPELINESSLQEIARLPESPGAAALSKALLEFEKRYSLAPARFQKQTWMRERYRRSALVRAQNKTLEH